MKILKCHLSRFSSCRESLGDPERDLLQVPDLRYLFANETRCPGTFLSLVSWQYGHHELSTQNHEAWVDLGREIQDDLFANVDGETNTDILVDSLMNQDFIMSMPVWREQVHWMCSAESRI